MLIFHNMCMCICIYSCIYHTHTTVLELGYILSIHILKLFMNIEYREISNPGSYRGTSTPYSSMSLHASCILFVGTTFVRVVLDDLWIQP